MKLLALNPLAAAAEELTARECIRIRVSGGNILPSRYQRRGKVFTVQPGGSIVVNDRELELAAPLSNCVASALDEGRLAALLEN